MPVSGHESPRSTLARVYDPHGMASYLFHVNNSLNVRTMLTISYNTSPDPDGIQYEDISLLSDGDMDIVSMFKASIQGGQIGEK